VGPFLDIRIPRYTNNWFAVSEKECIASASMDGLILIIHPTDFASVTKKLTTTAVKTTFTDPSLWFIIFIFPRLKVQYLRFCFYQS
jgi:hypothetical protein